MKLRGRLEQPDVELKKLREERERRERLEEAAGREHETARADEATVEGRDSFRLA